MMAAAGIAQGWWGFVAYVLSLTVLLRLVRGAGPTLVVLAAAIAIGVLAIAVSAGLGQRVNFWGFAASYGFFTLTFLMGFGAIYKSISLRILLDLSNRPGRAELYDRVLDRFIVQESFRNRLAVIEEQQFAARIGGCFALTRRGRRLACAIAMIQKFYRVGRSG